MRYYPFSHHRRSIRLKDYDYSSPGTYFLTLCTEGREHLFGSVFHSKMQRNDLADMVASSWEWLPIQYDYVQLDAWVIMPDHFHGILTILTDRRGGSRTAPTIPMKSKHLGRIIGAFKTVSTKRINEARGTPTMPVWQRNYYEHIIRKERVLNLIRLYIEMNPLLWTQGMDDLDTSDLTDQKIDEILEKYRLITER